MYPSNSPAVKIPKIITILTRRKLDKKQICIDSHMETFLSNTMQRIIKGMLCPFLKISTNWKSWKMDETNQLHETIKGRETTVRSDSDHWRRLDWGSFWSHCSIDQFHMLLLTTSAETEGIFCNEAWRRVCQRTMTVLTAEKWLLVFRNHKHWGKRQQTLTSFISFRTCYTSELYSNKGGWDNDIMCTGNIWSTEKRYESQKQSGLVLSDG